MGDLRKSGHGGGHQGRAGNHYRTVFLARRHNLFYRYISTQVNDFETIGVQQGIDDDLPDVVEKDTKPKFLTEVSNNSGQNQPISNGLVPLFRDDLTAKQESAAQAIGNGDDQEPIEKIDQPNDQKEQ